MNFSVKYALLSIVLVVFMVSCPGDETVKYPYENRIENIKGNLKEKKLDLYDTYAEALFEYSKSNSKEASAFLDDIYKMMKDEVNKLYKEGKYGEAVVMIDSMINAGIKDMPVSQLDCYQNYLKSITGKTDKFTLNELKNRMIDRGLLAEDEVYTLLQEYYVEKSAGLFIFYLGKYRSIYPGIDKKYPELNRWKEELSVYSDLDFEKLMRSVVTIFLDKGMAIKNGMGYQEKAIGTGFFIDDDGYILTNHHVIADHVDPKYEGYTNVTVTTRDDPDTEIKAKVVGWDKVYDVALLKVDIKNKDHLVLGKSNDMRIGDKIYTIGNPIGLKYTVTSGIISNKEVNFFQMGQAFQVDAAINPGNSGGPLIDNGGQVIGIVFAGVPQYQGISFAIPFEWVRQTIPFLYKGGEVDRSWIGTGVYEDRSTGELLFYYVMPGSGADRAGIKDGDKLISINGVKPATLEEAQSLVAWEPHPSLIKIKVTRDNKDIDFVVKADKRPYIPVETAFRKDSQANLVNLVFGLKLELMTKMFGARTYKVKKIYKGLSAYSLDISEGDPVMIYNLKYYEKEKAVVMLIRYMDKEVASMERIFTVQMSAEINTML